MKKGESREFITLENEGKQICGMLHRPLSKEKCPAVIMCHGFAGNRIGRYRIYVLIAQRLAEAGVACLRIDFRGSGESEGDFSEMTVESEVSDALKGIEFLRKDSHVDQERIGILGNSFGGAVAVIAAQRDRKIKSLVLLAALFSGEPWRKSWEKLVETKDEGARKELGKILDGYSLSKDFYKQFFQMNLEDSLKALKEVPMLHIHSEQDDRIKIEHALQYERCRSGASGESRWIRLNKCGHEFSNSEERAMIVEETAQWFKKTL